MMAMFVNGFQSILTLQNLGLIVLGVVMGIIFGAIPGLSANLAVALCLPITFGMSAMPAIVLLVSIYIGSISGGLISAILINIPGTPASIATTFDGYPMAVRGEAGKALGIGILYSFIGGFISILLLIFLAPIIAKAAIKFGPWEYFAVTVFSMTMISSLISDSVLNGLASAFLGLFFAMIGSAPIDSARRFTLGIHDLDAGFGLLPFLIGLFAVAEVLKAAQRRVEIKDDNINHYKKTKGFGISMKEFIGQLGNMIRSALIGTGIGILPGIGGGTSNIISYVIAKNRSKHPEKFGTGIIDGIVASETANNASIGGAMVPLLTLGIPGDGVTAILLGGLTIHGIVPGPMMFISAGNIVYGIFVTLLIANLIMVIVERLGLNTFAKVLKVPNHLLLPIVMLLCLVGAYGTNNRMFDLWGICLFGLVGFLMSEFDIPVAPALLGFILGPTLEANLVRGLMSSHGSFDPLFTSPISLVLIIISVLSLVYSIFKNSKRKRTVSV